MKLIIEQTHRLNQPHSWCTKYFYSITLLLSNMLHDAHTQRHTHARAHKDTHHPLGFRVSHAHLLCSAFRTHE